VAFLCTGCTVLSGAMDGKERFGSVSFGHSKEMNSTKPKAFLSFDFDLKTKK
jgi:hypothetical protein